MRARPRSRTHRRRAINSRHTKMRHALLKYARAPGPVRGFGGSWVSRARRRPPEPALAGRQATDSHAVKAPGARRGRPRRGKGARREATGADGTRAGGGPQGAEGAHGPTRRCPAGSRPQSKEPGPDGSWTRAWTRPVTAWAPSTSSSDTISLQVGNGAQRFLFQGPLQSEESPLSWRPWQPLKGPARPSQTPLCWGRPRARRPRTAGRALHAPTGTRGRRCRYEVQPPSGTHHRLAPRFRPAFPRRRGHLPTRPVLTSTGPAWRPFHPQYVEVTPARGAASTHVCKPQSPRRSCKAGTRREPPSNGTALDGS